MTSKYALPRASKYALATMWSTEMAEDREFGSVILEWVRRAELATRGFLGLVRCTRCHRRTRCVYTVAGRPYGRSCAESVA